MNHGLRNGGGVGDILRKPSKDVCTIPPIGWMPLYPAGFWGTVQSRQLPAPQHTVDATGSPQQPGLALRLGKV